MGVFRFVLVLNIMGFVLMNAAQAASCTPMAGGTPCLGLACDAVGTSMIDSDQKNIIVCLKDDSGSPLWKSSTSGSDTDCNIKYYFFKARIHGGSLISSGVINYENKQIFTLPCTSRSGYSAYEYKLPKSMLQRWDGTFMGESGSTCTSGGYILAQCLKGNISFIVNACTSSCIDGLRNGRD